MSSLFVASPIHAAAMAAVHAACFPSGDAWTAAAIAEQLALPGTFGLVAPEGGMVLARMAADEAKILTLAVAPALRRRGHGAALLAAAERAAAARGAATMYLEVAEDNGAARAMYVAAGYVSAGR